MRAAFLLTLTAIPAALASDIDCGGGASCPDTNTCCRNGEGGFSCCPVKDASCCADYVHCCPPDHPVCDLTTGSCTAETNSFSFAISSIPWLTKSPATITTNSPTATPTVTATLVESLVARKNASTTTTTTSEPDCSDNKCLYLITNPTSPDGKQHCQELDNPPGTEGGYWKSKGWKYTSPPWTQGKCDRNLFNYVNRETDDLDGFKGVTFWYLGIQV